MQLVKDHLLQPLVNRNLSMWLNHCLSDEGPTPASALVIQKTIQTQLGGVQDSTLPIWLFSMLSSCVVHTNQTEYYQQINTGYVLTKANEHFSASGTLHSSRSVTFYVDMLLQITTTISSVLGGLFL